MKRRIYPLRQKVEAQPERPSLLLNARGSGYRLAEAGASKGKPEVSGRDGM